MRHPKTVESCRKIHEAFKKQIIGQQQSCWRVISKLAFYKLYLEQFQKLAEKYPLDLELKAALSKIPEALACLDSLHKELTEINIRLYALSKLIRRNAVFNKIETGTAEIKGEDFKEYSRLLSEVLEHPEFRGLSAPILQLQKHLTPQHSYQTHLMSVLEVIERRAPTGNQALANKLGEHSPRAFLNNQIGNSTRFYTLIDLCVKDIPEVSDSTKTLISNAAKQNNASMGKVSEIKEKFEEEAATKQATSLLTKWQLNPKDSTQKYADTQTIRANIAKLREDSDKNKNNARVYRSLLQELRKPQYDYLRQCGTFGFFSRHRTKDTGVQTSASWSGIEVSLLEAAEHRSMPS